MRRQFGHSVRMEPMSHVKLPIVVRQATAGDVASMQAVDVAARQRFREIDDPRIARASDDPPYVGLDEGGDRAARVGGDRRPRRGHRVRGGVGDRR